MSATVAEAAQDNLRSWYPLFSPVLPPVGSAAVCAWLGRIQPFPDEGEYAGVMSHLERDEGVQVKRHGRLAHPNWCRDTHSFTFPFSPWMQSSFEILLLEFPGTRHPRVYGVRPEISRRRFPGHPHLRDDQPIIYRGKPLTALCTYLSSDGVLDRGDMELVHLLDYTSMYLAKHMLWVATNTIVAFSLTTNRLTSIPNSGALLLPEPVPLFHGTHAMNAAFYRTDANFDTEHQRLERWFSTGYWRVPWACWIGKSAPHVPAQMYQEIGPADECPCGTGRSYAECCRRLHGAA